MCSVEQWYNQEFHHYIFVVKLDRCVRSCNTLNGLSNEICAPKEVYLSVRNVITWQNE